MADFGNPLVLAGNFEVLSVTFQTESVNSKATPEYGWRVTPYAYLLLKARGPQVDKLPAAAALDDDVFELFFAGQTSLRVDGKLERDGRTRGHGRLAEPGSTAYRFLI